MLRILRDYLNLGRQEHLRFDFGISFLGGLITTATLLSFNVSLADLISKLSSLIGTIITAFSILAGFNTTSLSIFATSSSPIAEMLKNELIEGTSRSKIEQVLAYFSWSVVVQLTLLIVSIISSLILTYIPKCYFSFNNLIAALIWMCFFLGITAIFYSIFLTIRNVSILYKYLVAESRK